MSWQELARDNPELAAFGQERLHDPVAYLATIRPDGSPRLHPVRPIIAGGRVVIFMEPTSPKGNDLRRDGRCVLHGTSTSTQPWDLREFYIDGRAALVEDPVIRHIAKSGTSFPRDEHFLLFELSVEGAFSTVYGADGKPIRKRWHAA